MESVVVASGIVGVEMAIVVLKKHAVLRKFMFLMKTEICKSKIHLKFKCKENSFQFGNNNV